LLGCDAPGNSRAMPDPDAHDIIVRFSRRSRAAYAAEAGPIRQALIAAVPAKRGRVT
jgi:hypothetical protein